MAKSTLGAVMPLIITIFLLIVIGVVGFVAYQIARDVADKTSQKMEKKHHMSFSKDGVKVGVKDVSAEQVGDSTQNVLVKMWNTSAGQKSNSPATTPGTEKRKPFPRAGSSQLGK